MVVLTIGFFFSCSNSREEIQSVQGIDSTVRERMDSVVTTLYSRGDARAILRAEAIERHKFPDRTIFPDGLEVVRYDSLGQVESRLTAMRGVLRETDGTFEVFGDVVFKNLLENQALYTEYLMWENKRDSTVVHTNELVRIFDGKDVHQSNGAVTDERLSWYEFTDYQGIVVRDTLME